MSRQLRVAVARLGPIARGDPRGRTVDRLLEMMRQAKSADCDLDRCREIQDPIFYFALHREPRHYGLITERKGGCGLFTTRKCALIGRRLSAHLKQ